MTNKALVMGSVAFDYIMTIFPSIREEIPLKDGKLPSVNMSFVSDTLTVLRGGTAGNIGFGISFLGGKPVIHSVVGRDFEENYGSILRKYGAELALKTYMEYESARAYMISDKQKEQIIIWQPNAYVYMNDLEFTDEIKKSASEIKIGIFSPGTEISTLKGMKSLRAINSSALIIFDPGQMVLTYNKQHFLECIDLADVIIMNDTEWLKAETFGVSPQSIHKISPQKVIIETLGKDGSRFSTPNGIFKVGIAPVENIIEATGAGDAFRAGLIKALLDNESWQEAGKLGAALASLCIQSTGGQGYEQFSKETVYTLSAKVSVTRVQE